MTTRVSLILLGKMFITKSGEIKCVRFVVLKQPNKHIKTGWVFKIKVNHHRYSVD